jgi:hypothetical protein
VVWSYLCEDSLTYQELGVSPDWVWNMITALDGMSLKLCVLKNYQCECHNYIFFVEKFS